MRLSLIKSESDERIKEGEDQTEQIGSTYDNSQTETEEVQSKQKVKVMRRSIWQQKGDEKINLVTKSDEKIKAEADKPGWRVGIAYRKVFVRYYKINPLNYSNGRKICRCLESLQIMIRKVSR